MLYPIKNIIGYLQHCCTRTDEGRSRASVRGEHMGWPSAASSRLRPANVDPKRATLKELAESYNVRLATISGVET